MKNWSLGDIIGFLSATIALFAFFTGKHDIPAIIQAIKDIITGYTSPPLTKKAFITISVFLISSLIAVICLLLLPDKELPIHSGDIVSFGMYKQFQNESGEWQLDSIQWIVLSVEDDRMLLLSQSGLTYQQFSDNTDDSWDNSSLNYWINSYFFDEAFTKREKRSIIPTTDSLNGVFCLSAQEVELYLPSQKDRICKPTDYAKYVCINNPKSVGGKQPSPSEDGDYWWLRDSGKSIGATMNIRGNGEINTYGTKGTYSGIMVRPAIWISASYFVS